MKRPIANLAFVKIGYSLDWKGVDNHIFQLVIDVQFCIKLPHSLYDSGTGKVIPLTSPIFVQTPTIPSSTNQKLVFRTDNSNDKNGDGNNSDNNKKYIAPTITATTIPVPFSISSKMRCFVGSLSLSVMANYFGSSRFLDSHRKIDKVCGHNPIIQPVFPNSTTQSTCLNRVWLCFKMLMLDVFLDVCCEAYTGGNDVGSRDTLVHEICKISSY